MQSLERAIGAQLDRDEIFRQNADFNEPLALNDAMEPGGPRASRRVLRLCNLQIGLDAVGILANLPRANGAVP